METLFSPEGGYMGTLVSCSHALVLRDIGEQQRLTSQFRGIQPQPFRIVAFTKAHDKHHEDTSTHPPICVNLGVGGRA